MAAPFSTLTKRSLRKSCPTCDRGIYSDESMVWDCDIEAFVHERCPAEQPEVR